MVGPDCLTTKPIYSPPIAGAAMLHSVPLLLSVPGFLSWADGGMPQTHCIQHGCAWEGESLVKISPGKINVKTLHRTQNTGPNESIFSHCHLSSPCVRHWDKEMQGRSNDQGLLVNESWPFCHPWRIWCSFSTPSVGKIMLCLVVGWEGDFSKRQEVMWALSSETATISLAFLLVWLCSQPAARGVAQAPEYKACPNKIGTDCKAYFKKESPVLYNSIYMVILVTVLSLLEGGRRKVCETFSRRELQHGILLTCVPFFLENSRLSKTDSFSNTAALPTTAGQ